MGKELNIAEILKDKPNGTKLYADAFGELSFDAVVSNKDEIIFTKNKVNTSWCFYNDGKYSKYGESILVPSKEMRNWSKFAWKKGDILVGCAKKIIFDKFTDDTYSYFEGKYCLEQDPYSDYETYRGEDKGLLTKYFHIPERYIAQSYIKNIEERLGGKLNLETLEVEKPHPEFKDGDILASPSSLFEGDYVFIFNGYDNQNYLGYYVAVDNDSDKLYFSCGNVWCYKGDDVRYATDEEKQQLFEALAKKNKAWDAEKKAIVDLKPKVELKPFDKVLVRDRKTYHWEVDLFGFKTEGPNIVYHCVGGSWIFCIPYIGNESLLGTIKDAEK